MIPGSAWQYRRIIGARASSARNGPLKLVSISTMFAVSGGRSF